MNRKGNCAVDFLVEVLDFCLWMLGDVFETWMQNLARANRKLYIVVFGLLLLALAGGALAFLFHSLWIPAIALLLLVVFALILFVLGLRRPKDRRVRAWQAGRARRERDRRTRQKYEP